MKDENHSIQMIQKSLKKIKMVQFYIQFELTYANNKWIFLLLCFQRFMVTAVYTSHTSHTSHSSHNSHISNISHISHISWSSEAENKQRKNQRRSETNDDYCFRLSCCFFFCIFVVVFLVFFFFAISLHKCCIWFFLWLKLDDSL